jgi:hypothetical protein
MNRLEGEQSEGEIADRSDSDEFSHKRQRSDLVSRKGKERIERDRSEKANDNSEAQIPARDQVSSGETLKTINIGTQPPISEPSSSTTWGNGGGWTNERQEMFIKQKRSAQQVAELLEKRRPSNRIQLKREILSAKVTTLTSSSLTVSEERQHRQVTLANRIRNSRKHEVKSSQIALRLGREIKRWRS